MPKFRSRALGVSIAAVICGCVAAKAQEPVADIAASYAFVNAVGYGNDYHKGWLTSGAFYVSGAWSGVGEVGGSYDSYDPPLGSLPPLRASIYNFMGGPRFVLRRNERATTFAQILLGDVRVGNNYGGYVNDFAWQPGGGVDIALARMFAVRLQGDLRVIQSGGAVKEFRFASGIVIRK